MKVKPGILGIVLAVFLTGCNKETEALLVPETDVRDEDLNLMQKLLFNKVKLSDGRGITQLEGIYCKSQEEQESVRFFAIDLDRDGTNEVCVKTGEGAIYIFHEAEGKLYDYLWTEAQVEEFYYDGTFSGYKGEDSYSYYGDVDFSENELHYEVLASVWQENAVICHYYKNGEHGQEGSVEITKAEYNAIKAAFDMKRDGGSVALSGKLTAEDILEMVTEAAKALPEFPLEVSVPEENLSLMQKVLLNKAEFNGGQKIVNEEYICGEKYIESVYFYVVDLDHDGIEEVLIDNPSFNMLILHEEEGKIYGFYHTYRGFLPLYTDGTSVGSSGDNTLHFLGNISFEENEFKQEYITTSVISTDQMHQTRYYKNGTEDTGIEITEAEYEEIMSQYLMEEATKYSYTTENILEYVK